MIGLDYNTKDNAPEQRLYALDNAPTTWMDAIDSTFSLAIDNSPYEAIKRYVQREFADYNDQDIMPMAEFNEKYAELGLVVKKDVSREYARLLVEKKQEDLKREGIIARGPSNIFAQGSYFLAGLGGAFSDPINLGLSFVPVVGQGNFLRMVGRHGVNRARFYRGLKEGFVGNLAFEPIDAALAASEQREYGLVNSLYNVTIGSLVAGGLQSGLGRIGDFYKKLNGKENIYQEIADAPVELREDLINYSIGRLIEGKRINAKAFIEQTKLKKNMNLQMQKYQQMISAADFNVSANVNAGLKFKGSKQISRLEQEINKKLDQSLPRGKRRELKRLREKVKRLNDKIETRLRAEGMVKTGGLLKAQEIINSANAPDLELVRKTPGLSVTLAKLNNTNRKIRKIESKREQTFIKNFLEEQNLTSVKKQSVSPEILARLDEIKGMYGGPLTKLEIERNNLLERAKRIDVNSVKDTEVLAKIENKEIDHQSNLSRMYNTEYKIDALERIDVLTPDSTGKKLNPDDIVEMNREIKRMQEAFTGVENIERQRSDVLNDFIDEINEEVRIIDNRINKQNDIIKALKAGVSCVRRNLG